MKMALTNSILNTSDMLKSGAVAFSPLPLSTSLDRVILAWTMSGIKCLFLISSLFSKVSTHYIITIFVSVQSAEQNEIRNWIMDI